MVIYMFKLKKIFVISFYFLLISIVALFSFSFFSKKNHKNNTNQDTVVLKKVKNSYVPSNKKFEESSNTKTGHKKSSSISLLNKQKECKLFVFIHGTILPYPSFSTLLKTLKGDKKSKLSKKSFHFKYLNNLRYKGIYKYQTIDDPGLLKIKLCSEKKCSVQKKSSKKIANCYNYYLNSDFVGKKCLDNNCFYYNFGWPGHLNQKRRYCAADDLYKSLLKEIKRIKKKNKCNNVNVTILCHSHGGNVALKLADLEKKYKKNLKIKNLIMFGTPIQKETSNLIHSDVFEKIYNVYSRGDPVQVMDFVSTKSFYSKRKFHNNKKQNLPSKLVQIEVRCGKLKPMHNELWFLRGNWNLLYRRRLSIAPYPVLVFTPIFKKVIDKDYSEAVNLQLNIEKQKNKYKFSFKDLNDKYQSRKYLVNLPVT
ncbi:hypothetical protein GF385_02580 [Candidatus Dependentiae bacterium]|nr:hypothetical protein [Candidatus Dependentiae bacterium]